MLHRVVLKRSGRPSPEASALGFTAAHHLICVIVGKPVIAAGYSVLDRVVQRPMRGGRAADLNPQRLLKSPGHPFMLLFSRIGVALFANASCSLVRLGSGPSLRRRN